MADFERDPALEKGPIAWMANNAIAANLAMMVLFIGGIWSALNIQKEVFPQFELDIVNVDVSYPGAAPSEVESGILQPIEEAVRQVEGIREITSEAREGSASVEIEFVAGTDRMKAFQDVDQAIARIRTFPEEADRPEVELQGRQQEAMQLGLYGPVDTWTLRKLSEQLRDHLLSDPNITQVELGNVPDYITHVEIPTEVLRTYGLTLPEVANIIEASSQDIPAGAINSHDGVILLRLQERKVWAEEFANIEIVANASGATVRLSDIATITDGFEEGNFHSRFNGVPSVELEVFRTGTQSPLEIEEAVYRVMAEYERSLPPGVVWRIDSNNAEEYRDRLYLLLENGALSVVIVLAILSLFLAIRLAFWVMMGMAVSFIGGILFLGPLGVSINMISMFGFLVALGIVVDDAIVVGENTFEARKKYQNPLTAAIVGARSIAAPVTFSILSNVIAFIPLLFIPGETGKFWWPLPVVVMTVLIISLLEALFILPSHLAHVERGEGGNPVFRWIKDRQTAFANHFDRFVRTHYSRVLDMCLRNRYVTITAAIALLAVAGSYARSDHMGMVMMPEVSADEIEAGVRLPVGTTPEQAGKMALAITEATRQMYEEHDLHLAAEGIKTNVRGQNFLDIEIVMRPPNERSMTAKELIQLWRDELGDIQGVDQITFEAERGPGGWQQDISIDLSHTDIDVLAEASQALMATMRSFEGAADVNDNYDAGNKRIDFRLRPEGRALGLTPEDVGDQLRGAFFGALAIRQLRGTNETEVRVKLPESERSDLASLENFVIRTPDGIEVPILDVTEFEYTEAFSSITRRNGRRVVTVSADIEPKRRVVQVVTALTEDVMPKLQADFPGLTWSFQGSQAEMRRSTQALWGGFGLAIFVIYALLAIAFKSYAQPFIVLCAIPFGIIGAVIGHIIMGFDLSLISLMGIVALSGVVVNDSLIMTDYANKNREGRSAHDAIHMAGLRRFRPIILTTLTTFGGLTPILLETTLQAQHLIPMAISLGFGIVFATAIILILVPCLYMTLEDIKGLRPKAVKATA
ncbi:efflux RND transporter permease subunit [Kordiimonas gwangyangensis]|uniref:efflux RND transporter permease subunit n=1 Tax=Kordiimonas gwangyangensis TaxID=288022 RepID=UPI00036D77A6|nr:efflux RND transporter permease subunit [Kordiimonas gwangyangensis]